VRSAQEVSAIATRRPFPAGAVRASTGKLQVALLARPAPARARKQALALAGAHDLLAFGERELYWLPRARMTDSELDLARLEGLVGPWTMRTKATIEQLAERHLSA